MRDEVMHMNIFVPDSVKNNAREVLLKNLAATGGKYVCPSWPRYPHQWLWDSCFHAIALSRLELKDAAKNEIRRLFTFQQENGFIPHIQYVSKRAQSPLAAERFFYPHWKHHSSHTQPPVLARALLAIQDPDFTREVFGKVKKFFLYFIEFQDPDRDGLISNFIPTETGRDATPEYDRFYPRLQGWGTTGRLFNMAAYFFFLSLTEAKYRLMGWDIARVSQSRVDVEDLMFNSIWVDGMYVLSTLAESQDEKMELQGYAKRVEDAIIQKCWDEKSRTFWSLAKDNSFIKVMTVSNLFPLLLPRLPHGRAESIVNALRDPNKFWTPYPIPSVARDEQVFDADYREKLLWRGPTWVNTNWYLVIGLLRHGFTNEARELAERTVTMVEREGFREFYQPFTGKGMRVKNFGWSTLAVTFDSLFT
ncbi:MAG: hypothetical protein HYS15_01445 [Candidatus Spechtbacteria bacterium]|nr:hypothetical protein [Candidatus Spechtbacteria bacterium]